jgi:DNA-binding transcriptional LysR family regulator
VAAREESVAGCRRFIQWIVFIRYISIINIRAINLNLLVVLDALLLERNASRAGRRLGLSQPAVSNALAQLRTALKDPLFVRGPGGLLPTERALALAAPVRAALAGIEEALSGGAVFEPARCERQFVLAATDFVEFVLLPRLLARLGREAPGVKLQIRSWSPQRVPPFLAQGEADMMLGFYDQVPPGHRHRILFGEEGVCIVRRDHPRVGRRLTLKTYTELQHVLVTDQPAGLGIVDEQLAKRGLSRTVALRLSHFLMVPRVVAATDYVAAISRRVAIAFAQTLPLRLLPPPLPLPRGAVGLVWHERTDASAAHAWLRGVIVEEARAAGRS